MGEFRGGGDKESEDLKKNNLPVPATVEHVHLGESPKNMVYPILLLSFLQYLLDIWSILFSQILYL